MTYAKIIIGNPKVVNLGDVINLCETTGDPIKYKVIKYFSLILSWLLSSQFGLNAIICSSTPWLFIALFISQIKNIYIITYV